MSNDTDWTQEVNEAGKIVDETIALIGRKADELDGGGDQMRRRHGVSTFLTIVLGVSVPALVTFGALSENRWTQSIAVVIAIITASAAILRSTFRWGERFGHASLTGIALRELASSVKLRKYDVLLTIRQENLFQQMGVLNRQALRQMYSIVQGHLEKEMAVVSLRREENFEWPDDREEVHQKPEG